LLNLPGQGHWVDVWVDFLAIFLKTSLRGLEKGQWNQTIRRALKKREEKEQKPLAPTNGK